MSDTENRGVQTQPVSSFSISPTTFQWNPINSEDNIVYSYPGNITKYMKDKYGFPALYRWVIQKRNGSVFYYLGETDGLVPRRVYQYLNPGPSQKTNLRLHDIFHSESANGSKILLEYLTFTPFTLNNRTISQSSLTDPHVRRLLEELFTVLAQGNGERLLNK